MKRPFGNSWFDTFLARKTAPKVPNRDLAGKMVVFTGGTDGMGRVAVKRFAEMGADIYLFGRNNQKSENVINELRRAGYPGKFTFVRCDLGDLGQVRNAASEVLDRCEHIDYLINCAGLNFSERTLSSDGYEMNFAVNYLGPFLLTELLLEQLTATPNACIVHVTSATQAIAKLFLDDLQLEKHKWSMLQSYAQAKLCMIIHARDVAARLAGSNTTINCLNPGYIRTNLVRHTKGVERLFVVLFGKLAAPTWVGAERILAAALDSRYLVESGKFIYEDIFLEPNPLALDATNVTKLMKISHELTGLIETDNKQQ
ncbi:MAG: SDR family NAD(P)-dependent oxidoreductase [Gammaproteobacteria bacterium]|nr:SDR family NAD(P)-dependent oxidoreductase [Gammaproteobacteria bacterium]